MTDPEIIALLHQRNEQGLQALRSRYGRLCLSLAERMLDSREDAELEYEVIDLTGSGEAVMKGTVSVKSDCSVRAADYRIPAGEKRFYLIKWKNTVTGEEGINHYMSNIIDIDYDEYLGYMKECGFDTAFEGFGE